MDDHYTSIGTTARSNPVNNAELLFPSGMDLTKNRSNKPLVSVFDTATADNDDYDDEDFKFDNGSASNVTVTIKFSPTYDSVVTETDIKQEEHEEPEKGARKKTKKPKLKSKVCATRHEDDLVLVPTVDNQTTGAFAAIAPSVGSSQHTQSNIHDSKRNDNLYEEYERFVEPGTNIRVDHTTDTNSSSAAKSMISPVTRTPIIVDISNNQAGKRRTPIVVDIDATDDDEAEDFMEYLKELRNGSAVSLADDQDQQNHTLSTEQEQCPSSSSTSDVSITETFHTPIADSEKHATDNICSLEISKTQSGISELIVISDDDDATLSLVADIPPTVDRIVISDDESDEEYEECTGLSDFNFRSLTKSNKLGDDNIAESCNDSTGVQEVSQSNATSQINKDTQADEDDKEEEEEEEEEEENEDEHRKDNDNDTDLDDDNDDDDHEGNGGNGDRSGGMHEGDCDSDYDNFESANENPHNDDHRHDNSRNSGDENNDCDNGGNLSPGVRSRNSHAMQIEHSGAMNIDSDVSNETRVSISSDVMFINPDIEREQCEKANTRTQVTNDGDDETDGNCESGDIPDETNECNCDTEYNNFETGNQDKCNNDSGHEHSGDTGDGNNDCNNECCFSPGVASRDFQVFQITRSEIGNNDNGESNATNESVSFSGVRFVIGDMEKEQSEEMNASTQLNNGNDCVHGQIRGNRDRLGGMDEDCDSYYDNFDSGTKEYRNDDHEHEHSGNNSDRNDEYFTGGFSPCAHSSKFPILQISLETANSVIGESDNTRVCIYSDAKALNDNMEGEQCEKTNACTHLSNVGHLDISENTDQSYTSDENNKMNEECNTYSEDDEEIIQILEVFESKEVREALEFQFVTIEHNTIEQNNQATSIDICETDTPSDGSVIMFDSKPIPNAISEIEQSGDESSIDSEHEVISNETNEAEHWGDENIFVSDNEAIFSAICETDNSGDDSVIVSDHNEATANAMCETNNSDDTSTIVYDQDEAISNVTCEIENSGDVSLIVSDNQVFSNNTSEAEHSSDETFFVSDNEAISSTICEIENSGNECVIVSEEIADAIRETENSGDAREISSDQNGAISNAMCETETPGDERVIVSDNNVQIANEICETKNPDNANTIVYKQDDAISNAICATGNSGDESLIGSVNEVFSNNTSETEHSSDEKLFVSDNEAISSIICETEKLGDASEILSDQNGAISNAICETENSDDESLIRSINEVTSNKNHEAVPSSDEEVFVSDNESISSTICKTDNPGHERGIVSDYNEVIADAICETENFGDASEISSDQNSAMSNAICETEDSDDASEIVHDYDAISNTIYETENLNDKSIIVSFHNNTVSNAFCETELSSNEKISSSDNKTISNDIYEIENQSDESVIDFKHSSETDCMLSAEDTNNYKVCKLMECIAVESQDTYLIQPTKSLAGLLSDEHETNQNANDKTDMNLSDFFSSDTSSSLEDDDESDFESALDDEFWANTQISEVDNNDNESFTSNATSTVYEEATGEPFELPINLEDGSEIETDCQYADDTDDCESCHGNAICNFIEELEKHIGPIEIQPDITFMDNNTEMYTMQSEENTEDKDASTEQNDEQSTTTFNTKPPAPRTIIYTVPYLKESEVKKIDPTTQRKYKTICNCRKYALKNILPRERTDETSIVNDKEHLAESVAKFVKYVEEEIYINKYNRDTNKNESKPCEIQPGEILKVGRGYYIFGTAENLHLPNGLTLKVPVKRNAESQTWKPCSYFRGIPGIVHNAHKMSTTVCPKLALPKDSACHKILHACNRLATPLSRIDPPLSPSRPKPSHDGQHGMMQQQVPGETSDDNESTCSDDLNDLLMVARDLLNSSRFDDAESTFLTLYQEIQEKPEDNGRLLVETLTGLADICIRRSRMCRSNPLEWQWLCMHAIALLQYTMEFCDSELETQIDNQRSEWFRDHKQASELKCRPLEDAFNRALYNCMKHDANFVDPFQSFSLPNTPVSHSRKSNMFPLSSTMPQYLLIPGMRYRITDKGLTKQSADDADASVDWLAKFQHYCKDRLQSKDSNSVTEKILKSGKQKSDDDTESILSAGSHDSLDWDNGDLPGIEEVAVELSEQAVTPDNDDLSFEYEIASSETDSDGWDFFLNQRRNCDFQSVVQVVSGGKKTDDIDNETRTFSKETQDIYQHEKSEKSKKLYLESRDIISPLHEHSISLTLSRSFCRLADKLVQEEEYRKAETVYEKILDIIDAIQDGTAGMLRFSARIMKNLGTVKSKQGKSSSGLVLLNKALHTYRDLQDEEANFEIAIALIELGNGYIVGKNHEDSVFDDVIIAICDFFEKDSSDSLAPSSVSSTGSASQISQMTSSMGSTAEERNVEEAVMCYTEALSLLERYESDEKQVEMFAKSVMRLGDCYFMQKDYDKALECYEKSLGMFQASNIFGKDSLMENAHVLCMLGVSSFMLHVYPRAAAVFETALHMVRCAYGFKRTFLNGMLQSLAGITYYKMKNYHKCVSMCYQAYDSYCEIFGEDMPRLDKQKFWLVCQTLYVMGNSYNILNLQQKAMKYLTIARSLMKACKCRERRQFMRVLQILGDSYFAQYDYKTALTFYNEALEYGECESQISFDEVFDPNCASDEMTIHNHLVSKSAEAHLSMQQYQNAVHYLEQAHDMQEVMGEDIKEDLINTLNQLGHMHSVSGDVQKAIESYKECLEVFREIHDGNLGPAMCTTLGNLAAMCYVKACIVDDNELEIEMTVAADTYFLDAMKLENNAEVCVKYGNFLYSHCYFSDAIVHLRNALADDRVTADIVYGGLEKVTLPDLLQDEVDTQEEICLPSSSLARYLLVLCYKGMQDMTEAEINLVCLMEEVLDFDIPILHSLLGYAMMELSLFEEAGACFLAAAETEEDYQLAWENYCICLLIIVLRTLQQGVINIHEHLRKKAKADNRSNTMVVALAM